MVFYEHPFEVGKVVSYLVEAVVVGSDNIKEPLLFLGHNLQIRSLLVILKSFKDSGISRLSLIFSLYHGKHQEGAT